MFKLRDFTSQLVQFFNVLVALLEATIVLISDLVDTLLTSRGPLRQAQGSPSEIVHQLTEKAVSPPSAEETEAVGAAGQHVEDLP
jgi:hypothetical protein